MDKKNTVKTDNAAVSATTEIGTALAPAVDPTVQEYRDEKEIEGPLSLALSLDKQDDITMELRELMGLVSDGFGELTKPSDIYAMNAAFFIIGGATISDYLDKTTGELKTKHVFRLEFEGGIIKTIMQSTARPRAILARAATLAKMVGASYKAGPFKMVKKDVRQIQPAYIFEQQPGFRQSIGR